MPPQRRPLRAEGGREPAAPQRCVPPPRRHFVSGGPAGRGRAPPSPVLSPRPLPCRRPHACPRPACRRPHACRYPPLTLEFCPSPMAPAPARPPRRAHAAPRLRRPPARWRRGPPSGWRRGRPSEGKGGSERPRGAGEGSRGLSVRVKWPLGPAAGTAGVVGIAMGT